MHEAQVVLQVVLGLDVLAVDESLGEQAFLGQGVHLGQRFVGFFFLTGILEFALFVHIQVVLTGFQAAHAEQGAGEAEHVDPALVVGVFTGEQALDGVGAVQGLGVGNHAAQQGHEFVHVPGGVLADEQVGALGAVVAVVSLVDVFTEHVDRGHAVDLARFVHLGDDVAGSVIVLGHDLGGGAVGGRGFDLDLALERHVGGVHSGVQLLAGFRGEFAFAVQQLLHHVHTHQGHTLDVVDTVEVGAEVDGARFGVAGDGQLNDGVFIQVSLEVRHLIQVRADVDHQARFAGFAQLGGGAGQHIHLIQLLFPVVKLSGSAVALILVFKDNVQLFLNRHPGGLEVAGVIHGAGQFDAFTGGFRIKEQTGLGTVVAGRHPQGHRLVSQSDAHGGQRQDQRQRKRQILFHLEIFLLL